MDLYKIENSYWQDGINLVAGIDEAGRGPLAGPVIAACVILSKDNFISGLNDSKKLSSKKRSQLFDIITKQALDVSVGIVNHEEIDKHNILNATMLAMRRALGNIAIKPEQILVDGPQSDIKFFEVRNIIKGDSKSASIAAASIIAKVTRDAIMESYDLLFPEYHFNKNKGYGTKLHISMLEKYKATPIHRKSYKIVKDNIPTFNYFSENGNINKLGSQIAIMRFVKRGYKINSMLINVNNEVLDSIVEKNNILHFIKVLTFYKNKNYSIGVVDVKNYANYKKIISEYINKKELRKNFIFIVISVEFIQNKKPIIKTVFSEKYN